MIKKLYIIVVSVVLMGTLSIYGQKTSFLIGIDKNYLDGNDVDFKDVDPGDTLLFAPGDRKYLLVKNFRGTAGKPIIMMNTGGEVIIDTDHYFGISIQNCQYFRITGTGDPKNFYGIKIKRVAKGGGMGIGELSSDFEIDHISVENCMIGGIYAKTDPDCSQASVRDKFTQFNTIIHDNYIANVGDEGLYIGSTKYFGQPVQCDGKEVLLLPSLLNGVKIYNNIIKYSGWDGIQVSSASNNCQIYNNTVLYDSQLEIENQMSGITIGGGSKCDCYNNFISQGKGNGIESHGLGGYRIFNNIILDAGRSYKPSDLTSMKYGIFVTDISVQKDSAFYLLHNNIVNPKSEGIRFSSTKSKGNLISSNVIINPGNYDYYENDNTSFKGDDSYIMYQSKLTQAVHRNNYLDRNILNAGFVSQKPVNPEDFRLMKNSPLIDSGEDDTSVEFDFSGFKRPYGAKSDIGAFEFDGTTSNNLGDVTKTRNTRLMHNPVKDRLKIRIDSFLNPNLTLEIYNLHGILIYRKSNYNPGNHIVEVDISKIPAGIYTYKIKTGSFSESEKFVIL